MNRMLLIFVVLLVGLGSWYVSSHKSPATETSIPTELNNADALDTGNQTPITTMDLDYFPGAKGYLVRPENDKNYPGVVMIHENRGLRPEIKATAEQLAREGYMVLAVDLYKGKTGESQQDAQTLAKDFTQEEAVENLRAAAKYLRDHGATKIASLGWCFGGKQSVELAISGEKLDATVVYYGGGLATTTDKLSPIKWPVLGIFGDNDQVIPVEKVKEFESSLNTLGVKNEIHIYPGVGHAFANPSGMNYAPNETKDAWAKTTAFLATYLK